MIIQIGGKTGLIKQDHQKITVSIKALLKDLKIDFDITSKQIKPVMDQTNCSTEEAIDALIKNYGDVDTTFLEKRYAKNYNDPDFWHTFFLKR